MSSMGNCGTEWNKLQENASEVKIGENENQVLNWLCVLVGLGWFIDFYKSTHEMFSQTY